MHDEEKEATTCKLYTCVGAKMYTWRNECEVHSLCCNSMRIYKPKIPGDHTRKVANGRKLSGAKQHMHHYRVLAIATVAIASKVDFIGAAGCVWLSGSKLGSPPIDMFRVGLATPLAVSRMQRSKLIPFSLFGIVSACHF